MRLWLVRHAQPLIAPGLCYGRLDVAADADASAACARQLAAQLPPGTRVAASALQRCAQLARQLHQLRPDLAPATDARLQEMDFGQWEGRAWQAIAPAALQAWTDDFAHHAAGGSGESVSAFMARVASAYDALGAPEAPDSRQPGHISAPPPTSPARDVLWITHAGVIRAVDLLAQGLRQIERADQWPLQAPNYGQWRTLDLHIARARAPTPRAVPG